MGVIKQIRSDFYRSKGKNETFLEWFLIRKLDTKGKILFALFLWSIWIYLWTDIVLIVRIFQFVVLVEGILLLKRILSKIYRKTKKKWLLIVAKVLEAAASSTGNFETLGSKFSNETASLAACVLCYYFKSHFICLYSFFIIF